MRLHINQKAVIMDQYCIPLGINPSIDNYVLGMTTWNAKINTRINHGEIISKTCSVKLEISCHGNDKKIWPQGDNYN
jgi:hypothetical protein